MRGGMRGRGRRGYNGDAKNERSAAPRAKNKTIPRMSPRGERFKKELLSKIVPWEKITESLENFPYYVDQTPKALLMECVASHLKQKELRKCCDGLLFSSVRILLQSIPGTGRYLERLVRALARELQLPFLKYGDSRDYNDEEDNDEEEDGDDDDSYLSSENATLKRGDRVQVYDFDQFPDGISIDGVNYRFSPRDRLRGEVYEVDGNRVAVVINICGLKTTTEKDVKKKNTQTSRKAVVIWVDVDDVCCIRGKDALTHDCFTAMEALYEVMASQQQPLIVYFPDSHFGLSVTELLYVDEEVSRKMKKMFNQLPEDIVMICTEQWSVKSYEMEQYPAYLKQYTELFRDPPPMCKLFTNIICMRPPMDQDLFKTFLKQIEEDRLIVILDGNLRKIHKVLEDNNFSCTNLEQANVDRDVILTRKSVEKIVGWAINHYLTACGHPRVNEEKVDIPLESIKLAILRLRKEERGEEEEEEEEEDDDEDEDEEEDDDDDDDDDDDEEEEEEEEEDDEETKYKKRLDNIKNLASGYYEECLVGAVVCSEDIGLKFDNVGVLESVKKKLYETVILPMRRPELFSKGSLRPCQGLLLYGPPGTGNSHVAKALAFESGAKFINITAAVLSSKRREYGDDENPSRALFSYANKLAPVIIFVDEDDYLLGGRGHINKYDTSILNEFMAAWDTLKSKVSQKIVVVAATNRPYDLDDAVIRRMQRRIYVGLPDVENRSKIVKILLKKENLASGFSFEQLAEATQGYSGSDLEKLCVAAAYRPVAEFLEQESKGGRVAAIRPLDLNDLIHSKAKVRPSVAHNSSSMLKLRDWKEQYGEPEIDIDSTKAT